MERRRRRCLALTSHKISILPQFHARYQLFFYIFIGIKVVAIKIVLNFLGHCRLHSKLTDQRKYLQGSIQAPIRSHYHPGRMLVHLFVDSKLSLCILMVRSWQFHQWGRSYNLSMGNYGLKLLELAQRTLSTHGHCQVNPPLRSLRFPSPMIL